MRKEKNIYLKSHIRYLMKNLFYNKSSTNKVDLPYKRKKCIIITLEETGLMDMSSIKS